MLVVVVTPVRFHGKVTYTHTYTQTGVTYPHHDHTAERNQSHVAIPDAFSAAAFSAAHIHYKE